LVGLVQDLEVHGRDYANKHLSSHSTYILMEKKPEDDSDDAASISAAMQFNYIPLLEKYAELYPNFRVHLSETQKKKLKPLRNVAKSPSPAGKMGTKSHLTASKAPAAGKPPRSSSRQRSSSKH